MSRASSQYRPLSDYALIGDGYTAALVSGQGSIDWLCAPSFDSPSVFASLLDARRGGYFAIRPVGDFESQMSYIGHSAAVKNRFRTASGVAELTDFMPVSRGEDNEPFGMPGAERRVVRLIEGMEGEVTLLTDYFPRPQFGVPASTLKRDEGGVSIGVGGRESLVLRSSIPLTGRDHCAEARGERDLDERTLEHLDGYLGSKPVRVGNAASRQFQLDVYGELLECFDVVRRADQLPVVDANDMWPAFRGQVEAVAARWREPDSGIWEVRSEPRHFVHSKVLAWVALDRGIRAAEQAGLSADLPRWRRERDAVRNEVMTRGYDTRLGSFVQSYGSSLPDAANLLLPIVGFIDASHPYMRSSIELIERRLLVDGLVYRYRETDDGLPGRDATFAVCTYWLVENLAALGRLREARELFEAMLARTTPLGLFAEEIDPQTGAHLGNFPQALTHLGLVNAAVALARHP